MASLCAHHFGASGRFSSHTKVHLVIYGSGSVPEQSIFSPRETLLEPALSPSSRATLAEAEMSFSSVTQVNRGSAFAWRRSTLAFGLGVQRSCKGNEKSRSSRARQS